MEEDSEPVLPQDPEPVLVAEPARMILDADVFAHLEARGGERPAVPHEEFMTEVYRCNITHTTGLPTDDATPPDQVADAVNRAFEAFRDAQAVCPHCFGIDFNWDNASLLSGACSTCEVRVTVSESRRMGLAVANGEFPEALRDVTPEELERRRERANAVRAEREERELKLKMAEGRAARKLKECLSEDEREFYGLKNYLLVPSKLREGCAYQIERGSVRLIAEDGEAQISYCLHPLSSVAPSDTILAQYLMLLTDEEHFLRDANKFDLIRRVRLPEAI